MSPRSFTLLALLALLPGCWLMRPSAGRGEGVEPRPGPRSVDAGDVAVPAGYRVEALATGLTFPSGVAFDGTTKALVTGLPSLGDNHTNRPTTSTSAGPTGTRASTTCPRAT